MASRMVKGTDVEDLKKTVNKLREDNEVSEAIIATQGQGASSAGDEVQRLILERFQKRAAEEQAAEVREREVRKKRMLEIARSAEHEEKQRQWEQAACSHLDGLNQKRTGGQFNSDGFYTVYCLHCSKKFTNAPGGEPCPNHLWPEEIGGAIMEAVNRVGAVNPIQPTAQ